MSAPAARGFYLAVDTATEACSVAAWIDGKIAERFEAMQREHTLKLLPMIRSVLADCGRTLAQLDGIVCGIGPGSFAGLRIGVGAVKGIALGRDLPVVGVSSLAMLAQRAVRLAQATEVAAVIDARMSEIYFGAYRPDPRGGVAAVIPDQVCAPSAAPSLPPGVWSGVGTGWSAYESVLRKAVAAAIRSIEPDALPHAEDALWLGVPEFAAGRAQSADALVPSYVRDRVALTLTEQAALRR